jgi:hypothetical protein
VARRRQPIKETYAQNPRGQRVTCRARPRAVCGVCPGHIRIAKNFRFGGTRTNVGFDLTNVLNATPVLTYNEAFSTTANTWLRPNSVLQPRLAKFSAQFNF